MNIKPTFIAMELLFVSNLIFYFFGLSNVESDFFGTIIIAMLVVNAVLGQYVMVKA